MQISQACPSISLTVHGALGAREQAQDPKPQKQKLRPMALTMPKEVDVSKTGSRTRRGSVTTCDPVTSPTGSLLCRSWIHTYKQGWWGVDLIQKRRCLQCCQGVVKQEQVLDLILSISSDVAGTVHGNQLKQFGTAICLGKISLLQTKSKTTAALCLNLVCQGWLSTAEYFT